MTDLIIPLFAVRHGFAYGVASATYNLAIGLAEVGKEVKLPITARKRLSPDFLVAVNDYPNLSLEPYWEIPGGMPSRFVEESIFLNTKRHQSPIVFPNYFLPPDMIGQRSNLFVRIHDCQHRSLPQYFSAKKRAWLDVQFSRTLRKAARTLLISEFERKQVAAFFGDSLADRCVVIPNAIDWSKFERGEPSEPIVSITQGPYILSVAHQYPHKNMKKVVDAFVKACPYLGDTILVLVGRPSTEIGQLLESVSPPTIRQRIFLTGLVSDADLGHLYRNAQLFVLASDYEGFGMPAVEAMGFGIPTLVTKSTALPEVTLQKAEYCDADVDADRWAGRIRECLQTRRNEEDKIAIVDRIRSYYAPAAIAKKILSVVETG